MASTLGTSFAGGIVGLIKGLQKKMQAVQADKAANPTLYDTPLDIAAQKYKLENAELFSAEGRKKYNEEFKDAAGGGDGFRSIIAKGMKEKYDTYSNMVTEADRQREIQRKQNSLLETIAKGPEQPAPAPTIEDPNPSESAGMRRKKLAALRRGIQSTLNTGGQGLGGSGIIATPGASVMAAGMKQRLGQ